MTVKELIKELKDLNEDMEAGVVANNEIIPIGDVLTTSNGIVVVAGTGSVSEISSDNV